MALEFQRLAINNPIGHLQIFGGTMELLFNAISVIAFCGVMCSCSQINQMLGQPDDWAGEQLVEAVIEMETGVRVDLTPVLATDLGN